MPRKARKTGNSGYYHVVIRGVDRRDIFLDTEDRMTFLRALKKYIEETDTLITVYCLMDNHVHLIVKSKSAPGKLIQKLLSSYVRYFNHKYVRSGHLFQARYFSDPLETDRSLLAVARYILRNPQEAGISKAQDYPWSSWHELTDAPSKLPEISNTQILEEIAGGKQALLSFVVSEYIGVPSSKYSAYHDTIFCENVYRAMEEDLRPYPRLTDQQALEKMRDLCGGNNPLEINNLSKSERNERLQQFKKIGIPVRQIARLTGLDRNSVQRAK